MSIDDLDKSKQLVDVNFESEGCHLAVVHKLQGGAANGYHSALITKATDDISEEEIYSQVKKAADVSVTMSMEAFLRKFFDMYYDDASVLAKLLGYELESEGGEMIDSYEDYINSRVEGITLLKSLFRGEEFTNFTLEKQIEILKAQEKIEKEVFDIEKRETLSVEQAVDKVLTDKLEVHDVLEKVAAEDQAEVLDRLREQGVEGGSQSEGVEKSKDKDNKGVKMTDKDNANVEELQKSLEDLQKSLDKVEAEKKALEEEKINKAKEGVIEKASGISFLEEKEKEEFVEFLKSVDVEVGEKFVATLEKADKQIKELEENTDGDMFTKSAARGEGDPVEDSLRTKVKANISK